MAQLHRILLSNVHTSRWHKLFRKIEYSRNGNFKKLAALSQTWFLVRNTRILQSFNLFSYFAPPSKGASTRKFPGDKSKAYCVQGRSSWIFLEWYAFHVIPQLQILQIPRRKLRFQPDTVPSQKFCCLWYKLVATMQNFGYFCRWPGLQQTPELPLRHQNWDTLLDSMAVVGSVFEHVKCLFTSLKFMNLEIMVVKIFQIPCCARKLYKIQVDLRLL